MNYIKNNRYLTLKLNNNKIRYLFHVNKQPTKKEFDSLKDIYKHLAIYNKITKKFKIIQYDKNTNLKELENSTIYIVYDACKKINKLLNKDKKVRKEFLEKKLYFYNVETKLLIRSEKDNPIVDVYTTNDYYWIKFKNKDILHLSIINIKTNKEEIPYASLYKYVNDSLFDEESIVKRYNEYFKKKDKE